MAISFACAECGKKLRAPDNLAGKRIKCPACQTAATVPFPETAEDDELLAADWLNSDAAEDPDAKAERRAARLRAAREAELAKQQAETDEEPETLGSRVVARFRKQKPATRDDTDPRATRAAEPDTEAFHFHWVFLLALIPLTLTTFWPQESLENRVQRLLNEQPQLAARVEQAQSLDEFVALFPGERLPGALFGRHTYGHWVIGGIAAVSYLTLLFLMFPGSGKRTRRLFLTGLFTGTIGILLLLLFQLIASLPRGLRIRGRGIGVLIFLVLQLIGFSYRCASDPTIGFWGSFFGFTIGVGLCEELCKAMPIWFYLTSARKTGWRGACLVGLASGIGFGVSEGIMYSGDMYNGIHGAQIYLVRFLSCVSLHAMWSGSVALLMYRNQDFFDMGDLGGMLGGMFYYLGAAMVLHGLYDTLLKHDLPYVALLIGFGTYFWLFQLVASSRGT